MFEAHFQSFEDRSERTASAPRVEALRAELAWFNAYHAHVRDTLASSLDAATRAWLITATAPLARA